MFEQDVSREIVQNPPETVITFGNHDYNLKVSDALFDEALFKDFLASPESEWSPSVVSQVLANGKNQVLSIDSLYPMAEASSLNTFHRRKILFDALPFMGDLDECDVVLADLSLRATLQNSDNPEFLDIDLARIYSETMRSERFIPLKDLAQQMAKNVALISAISSVALFIKYREKEKIKLGLTRRQFLTGVSLAFLGSFAKQISLGKSELTLPAKSAEEVVLRAIHILSPDIHNEDLIDGRTALIFASTQEYAQRAKKNAQVVLGSAHMHSAERIMHDRAFRVERIKHLYLANRNIILTVAEQFQVSLTDQEVTDLAKKMINGVQVAHVRRPPAEDAATAFHSPENFVTIEAVANIPELEEALSQV